MAHPFGGPKLSGAFEAALFLAAGRLYGTGAYGPTATVEGAVVHPPGVGEFPPANAIWNTCTRYRINLKYPNDITMVIAGGHDDIRGGAKWIGTDGWVSVDRGH